MTPRPLRQMRTVRRAAGLLAVAGLAALLSGGCAPWRLARTSELVAQSAAFRSHPAQATRRVLVVGDSTAVGTGATHPAFSVAGRMAAEHPSWWIDNRAHNGARLADVVDQLSPPGERYDLVLVLAGGNDVMRLTSTDDLHAQLEQVVALARRKAPKVVLMPCGDVGHAPFFWPPVSWWMSARARTLHAVVGPIAARTGSVYVSLLHPAGTDPFVAGAAQLNAADGLHPNDAGYALWFDTLKAQGGL